MQNFKKLLKKLPVYESKIIEKNPNDDSFVSCKQQWRTCLECSIYKYKGHHSEWEVSLLLETDSHDGVI